MKNIDIKETTILDIKAVAKSRLDLLVDTRLEYVEALEAIDKEIEELRAMLEVNPSDRQLNLQKRKEEHVFHKRKLTNIQKKKLKDLWEEGEPSSSISEKLKIPAKTVQYYITKFNREAGAYEPNHRLRSIITREVEDKIYTLIGEGLSSKEICEKLSIKQVTFNAWKNGRSDLAINDKKRSVMTVEKYMKLKELSDTGLTRSEAAQAIGVTTSYLSTFLWRHKELVFLGGQLTDKIKEKIISLMKEGKSNPEIAKITGRGYHSVWKVCNEYKEKSEKE